MKKLANIVTTLFLLTICSELAMAQVEEVESILDQLERRLEEREGQVLSIEERQALKDQRPPQQKVRLKKATITGQSQDEKRLRDIADAVSELEGDVEQLDNQVQLTRQKVLENARINNFVEIEVHLPDPKHKSIRTLKVDLDGYEVYNLDETSGLWVPSMFIPVYSGPLTPGKHRLKLEARLVKNEESGLPLNTSAYEHIQQEKGIDIPDGQIKKRIKLVLKSQQESNTSKKSTPVGDGALTKPTKKGKDES